MMGPNLLVMVVMLLLSAVVMVRQFHSQAPLNYLYLNQPRKADFFETYAYNEIEPSRAS